MPDTGPESAQGPAGDRRPSGDEAVDAAVRSLPQVPESSDVDLEEPIAQVTDVHRRLHQRLSDLSR